MVSFGTSLAKVGHDDCKVFHVLKKTEQFDLFFFFINNKVNNKKC